MIIKKYISVVVMTLSFAAISVSISGLDYKEMAKRKSCEKSCQVTKDKAINDCTEKLKKDGAKKDKKEVDPKCEAAGKAVETPCIDKCMKAAN
jgi:hypothetical protein